MLLTLLSATLMAQEFTLGGYAQRVAQEVADVVFFGAYPEHDSSYYYVQKRREFTKNYKFKRDDIEGVSLGEMDVKIMKRYLRKYNNSYQVTEVNLEGLDLGNKDITNDGSVRSSVTVRNNEGVNFSDDFLTCNYNIVITNDKVTSLELKTDAEDEISLGTCITQMKNAIEKAVIKRGLAGRKKPGQLQEMGHFNPLKKSGSSPR